ncbi:hypothetical protein IQ273_07415 [Nodosilinea sp. LEGE 07298]|uniref:hypothetical protein n=1 Tax=Nodosilinea sp. LEGE 07298 TaxID=2777970 RepID=UPI0018803BC1|nr:hypothetical protein [Nodosilinea sp. LEGE 07298]MBE9109242.1 hypothetical protein [Nodosilinea sp. LEGE 07298]
MSTTPPNVLQLARQGDPDAIAALMNRHLETQGITAHVAQQESTLQVNLEGAQIPNQADLVAFVKKGITGLDLAAVHHLTVSGKQVGAGTSAWSEDLVLQTTVNDVEFDLDTAPGDASVGDALASDDLDLEFDLDSAALDTTDLGDLDMALGNDLNEADLDLDLGLTSSDLGLEAPTDFDLNFTDSDFGLDLTDPGSEPEIADSFNLDFGDNAAADLDLDLSDGLANDLITDNGFDLDLAMPEEPSADPIDLDFDLGLGEATVEPTTDSGSLDFDLGLSEAAAEPPVDSGDLDFDLGFTEAATEQTTSSDDLDFDLGLPDGPADANAPTDVDFELNFGDQPVEAAPTSDLDFDLGSDDNAADAAADLDLGWADEPALDRPAGELDLDFGLADEPAGAPSAIDLDLDFDLPETPAPASATDDLELGTADFDFGFDDTEATGSEATLDITDDLELDFGTGFDAEANLDLAEADADFGMEELEAIADVDNLETDGSGFDLNAPPAPLTAPEVEADLDDLWDDSDTNAIAPGSATTDLSAVDDLAAFDIDLTSEFDRPDEWSDLAAIPDDDVGTEALELDTGDPDLAAIPNDDVGTEALELDTGDPDAIAFTDLGLESEDPSIEAIGNTDDLPPDLIIPDEPVFADLGAAADLDLAAGNATDDWAGVPADLSWGTEADTDLEDTADFDLAAFDLAEDSSAEAPNTPFTDDFNDFDLAAEDDLSPNLLSEDAAAPEEVFSTPDLSTDFDADLGTDFDTDWAEPTVDPDFANSSTPSWEESADDFDSDLALDTPSNIEADLGTNFDPGLVFDPLTEAGDATPNPFEAEAFLPEGDDPYSFNTPEFEADGLEAFGSDSTPGFEPEFVSEGETVSPEAFTPEFESGFETDFAPEADADLPFSTMELDQTAAGNFVPNLDLDDSASELDAYDEAFFVEQTEDNTAEAELIPVPMEFGHDADEDLAFESVEFEGNDFGSSGFDTPGFNVGDVSAESDFEAPEFSDQGFGNEASFGDEGFSNESFGEEDFDADVFSDSHDDSNGFIQDRNGVALMADEPDATDDFIQEFGSDPSTHVALTPDQFNDDGSVRRRSGSSGLPMRLILGLGLGALVLALAGLLLNGVLGRLRSLEGDPVATESAVPDPANLPTDPATVTEEDLFRQAVNAAQTAANQAQTASTPAQWQEVADAWALSISLMQRVPASDPNYATAQQKAIDYQPNLNYAQQNAERLQ